jgi:hypothetical protein
MKKLIGATLLSLCWTSGMTQSDFSDRFVGTWILQVIEQKNEAGNWTESDLLGPHPLGILIYDEHGNMAAQLVRRDRSIPDPEGSPAELVHGYVAYFGTYEVDSTAGTVTHHRSAHVNPELGHLTVARYFRFEGDTLVLTVAPEREYRLIWKRQN